MEYHDFYDSDAAAEMASEYNKSIASVAELLTDADLLEKQIKATHSIFLRRRRVRVEIKLQRTLLKVLMSLSPADQQLGRQVYERLVSCVDRLDRLC